MCTTHVNVSHWHPQVTAKSKHLVSELAKCQQHICATNVSMCGWVAAFDFKQVVALENHKGTTNSYPG